jgi:glycosyltransferase EpsJ
MTGFRCKNRKLTLLIDDGSTDRSGEICDDYAAKDPRIRVIHKSNEGISASRNLDLSKAAGEFMLFVDSDEKRTI